MGLFLGHAKGKVGLYIGKGGDSKLAELIVREVLIQQLIKQEE